MRVKQDKISSHVAERNSVATSSHHISNCMSCPACLPWHRGRRGASSEGRLVIVGLPIAPPIGPPIAPQVPDKYIVVEAMDAVQTHFLFVCEWL